MEPKEEQAASDMQNPAVPADAGQNSNVNSLSPDVGRQGDVTSVQPGTETPQPLQGLSPAAPVPPAPSVGTTVGGQIAPVPQLSGIGGQAPAGSYTSAAEPVPQKASAGLIILQWLTYAFWGWTVLALSILTTTVIASFIAEADTGGFMPYGIAAVLVLLPISFVVDSFYSKKEPQKKTGAEMLVMVIHAVLFDLFAIGALIGAVIALVQLITSSADTSGIQVGLYSCLIITAYYALTFLRTLNPAQLSIFQRLYRFVMLASVGLIALLGIIGPVSQEVARRDDKLIESSLGGVSRTINNYAVKNKKLPTDLNALSLTGDEKKLVEKGLVEYKPEGPVTLGSSRSSTSTYSSRLSNSSRVEYRYQLCVTYKKESRGYGKYSSSYDRLNREEYSSYISAYSHPAGEVCYKVSTTDY